MSLVLSHQTAQAFHGLSAAPLDLPKQPVRMSNLLADAPTSLLVATARSALQTLDMDPEDTLHVLVPGAADRRRIEGVACHVHSKPLPARSLMRLSEDISICDIRLCALQAATYLDELELIEYLYEICGTYELGTDMDGDLRQRPQLTSTGDLRRYLEKSKRASGAEALKRALPSVRDGTRSPMETAFVMMLVLPKRLGGLGIRSLAVDYRVDVPKAAQALTRRSCFYFDAYIPSSRTDIEYNGFYHKEDLQRAIDEERRNTLAAMNYNLVEISRHSFMDRASFNRAMKKIMRLADVRPSRLPEGFAQNQELLRRFVLRRWL